MSKIDLSLDFDEIRERIDLDRVAYKPTEWAKFVGVSKNIVTNIHGNTRQKPSLEYVVAVARSVGKPIEWYLFGDSSCATSSADSSDFMNGWTQEVKTACGLVKEIIESGDKIIVPALLTSLPAMRAAVEGNRGLEEKKMYERRIRELERDVRRLQKLLEPGFGGAAGEEDGSASKKKKTSSI